MHQPYRNISILILLLGMLVQFHIAKSQTELKILPFDKYMDIVKTGHPVAMQAGLKVDEGRLSVQESRGGFDPELNGSFNEKTYQEKEYYQLLDAGLKIPTWYGIELEGGYANNRGAFLNPENNLPAEGLWYGGISVPIGKGLFIDERRLALRSAQVYQEMTEAEQRIMLNDLLYEASLVYWDWFKAYNKMEIYRSALAVAEQRLEQVKSTAELGDRPYIDTVEAGIQVQNRMLGLEQSLLEFNNAQALMNIYLWADGKIPMEIDTNTRPSSRGEITTGSIQLEQEMDEVLAKHPEIQKLELSIDQLKIERRWKRESLKPDLNLKYNLLSSPNDNNPYSVSGQDQTVGVELSFPLFLREERAALKMNNLKIRETEFYMNDASASIRYKVNAARNTFESTLRQIELYQANANDFGRLLDGERQMFDGGESSLFMVNAREIGYIAAQIKLVDMIARNQKAFNQVTYALGQLGS